MVYLYIKFNSEGTEKLAEVSKTYLQIDDSEEEDTTSDTEETETEESEETEEETQKKVTMTIEGTEFLTTYFAEEITTGELTISIGSGTDEQTLLSYATEGGVYAMLLNNDEMPLTYTITSSETMQSSINTGTMYVIIGILVAISVLLIIYLIIKFKIDGLLCGISYILAIAILLILIRYTSTVISLGGISAMAVLIAFDAYFMIRILKEIQKDPSYENVSKVTYSEYLKKIDLIIVFLIVSVVFTFMSTVQVYSIGMILFYGIVSLIISNLVFMRTLLIAKHK